MQVGTSGIERLDAVLGGVFWGDNVVWEAAEPKTLRPFVHALATVVDRYEAATWVVLEPGSAVPDGFDGVDATVDGPFAQPRALLEAIRDRCVAEPRHLVVVDELSLLAKRWGAEAASRFFVHACPMLLGIGSIAIWQLATTSAEPLLRRRVEEVTQCVLNVSDGVLQVSKAEGRPAGVEGSVFRYAVDASGSARLEDAPASTRLSLGLKALRRDRRLSQAEIARLAEVSASAVSQAERGQRGLSLETLLTLADRLGITVDGLLRGDATGPGYRLARRDDPRRSERDRPVELLADADSGLHVHVVRLSPGVPVVPGFAHKGTEIVAIAQGLVQVTLATGRPVLRPGEALIAEGSGVQGWRNLSDRDALAFWVLHD